MNKFYTWMARIILAALVIVISYIALIPGGLSDSKRAISTDHPLLFLLYSLMYIFSDKTNHIIAFFVLSFYLDVAYCWRNNLLIKVMILFGYGLFIELAQSYLPYREPSIADVGANLLGIAVYMLLALYFNKRTDSFQKQLVNISA